MYEYYNNVFINCIYVIFKVDIFHRQLFWNAASYALTDVNNNLLICI